ncbi:MAG: YgjV family protein [Desulfamplus sp.]|nr:YgjV family protein [Desulfamplus sp.]
MLSNFLFSQILIAIAICVDIISFQFKERNKILVCLVISTVLISSHFMLLGYWTAALLGLISVARYLSGMFTTSNRIMWLFLIIILVTTISSFEGLLSIVGSLGTIFTTIAAFRNDDKRLRQFMFIGTMIWIIHNYFAGSPGAVIMEIIFIISNFVGYFRYYIKPNYKYLKKITA